MAFSDIREANHPHNLIPISLLFLLICGIVHFSAGLYYLTISAHASTMLMSAIPWFLLLIGTVLGSASAAGLYALKERREGIFLTVLFVHAAVIFAQLILFVVLMAKEYDLEIILYDEWSTNRRVDPEAIARTEKAYRCCGFATVRDRPVPADCVNNDEFGFEVACRDVLLPMIKSQLSRLTNLGVSLVLLQVRKYLYYFF